MTSKPNKIKSWLVGSKLSSLAKSLLTVSNYSSSSAFHHKIGIFGDFCKTSSFVISLTLRSTDGYIKFGDDGIMVTLVSIIA